MFFFKSNFRTIDAPTDEVRPLEESKISLEETEPLGFKSATPKSNNCLSTSSNEEFLELEDAANNGISPISSSCAKKSTLVHPDISEIVQVLETITFTVNVKLTYHFRNVVSE